MNQSFNQSAFSSLQQAFIRRNNSTCSDKPLDEEIWSILDGIGTPIEFLPYLITLLQNIDCKPYVLTFLSSVSLRYPTGIESIIVFFLSTDKLAHQPDLLTSDSPILRRISHLITALPANCQKDEYYKIVIPQIFNLVESDCSYEKVPNRAIGAAAKHAIHYILLKDSDYFQETIVPLIVSPLLCVESSSIDDNELLRFLKNFRSLIELNDPIFKQLLGFPIIPYIWNIAYFALKTKKTAEWSSICLDILAEVISHDIKDSMRILISQLSFAGTQEWSVSHGSHMGISCVSKKPAKLNSLDINDISERTNLLISLIGHGKLQNVWSKVVSQLVICSLQKNIWNIEENDVSAQLVLANAVLELEQDWISKAHEVDYDLLNFFQQLLLSYKCKIEEKAAKESIEESADLAEAVMNYIHQFVDKPSLLRPLNISDSDLWSFLINDTYNSRIQSLARKIKQKIQYTNLDHNSDKSTQTAYTEAIKLLQSDQIPVRAEGFSTLKKLILSHEIDIDPEDCFYTILDVLNAEDDSYVYLYAIKAIVALSDVAGESQIRLYLNEYIKRDKLSIDVRNRLGEAIILAFENKGQFISQNLTDYSLEKLVECLIAPNEDTRCKLTSMHIITMLCRSNFLNMYGSLQILINSCLSVIRFQNNDNDEKADYVIRRAALQLLGEILKKLAEQANWFAGLQEGLLSQIMKAVRHAKDVDPDLICRSLAEDVMYMLKQDFLNTFLDTDNGQRSILKIV